MTNDAVENQENSAAAETQSAKKVFRPIRTSVRTVMGRLGEPGTIRRCKDTVDELERLTQQVETKITARAGGFVQSSGRSKITRKDVRSAFKLEFGEGFVMRALTFVDGVHNRLGDEVLPSLTGDAEAEEKSLQIRSGLAMPITRIKADAKRISGCKQMAEDAAVELAAIMEFFVEDVCRRAQANIRDGRVLIARQLVIDVLLADADFAQLLGPNPVFAPSEKKVIKRKAAAEGEEEPKPVKRARKTPTPPVEGEEDAKPKKTRKRKSELEVAALQLLEVGAA